MPEVCSDKIETPPAKKKMGELFHVKYLNILVQHTMNTCVTNNQGRAERGAGGVKVPGPGLRGGPDLPL